MLIMVVLIGGTGGTGGTTMKTNPANAVPPAGTTSVGSNPVEYHRYRQSHRKTEGLKTSVSLTNFGSVPCASPRNESAKKLIRGR
jgi:hypothetical protein